MSERMSSTVLRTLATSAASCSAETPDFRKIVITYLPGDGTTVSPGPCADACAGTGRKPEGAILRRIRRFVNAEAQRSPRRTRRTRRKSKTRKNKLGLKAGRLFVT